MEMEKTGAAPTPPTYAAHRPADLVLPAVPQTQPVVQTRPVSDLTLPNLQTILSPDFHHPSRPANNALAARGISDSPASGHSLPRILPAAIQVPLQSPEAALMSPSETGSAMSVDDRPVRSTSVVSMDDPDVQLAARALSELGNTGKSLRGVYAEDRVLTSSFQAFPSPNGRPRSHVRVRVSHVSSRFGKPSRCWSSSPRLIRGSGGPLTGR